jgi:bacterioferritin (cytochrome b1)
VEKIAAIKTDEDVIRLLTAALEHEWAVSFEYLIHAYSMPKGKYLYDDPVLKQSQDMRAQTIQIGIDEMYHALQLGTILTRLGAAPTFATDEVRRYPRIIDNLDRDKMTEDQVTDLYRSARLPAGVYPKVENMIWNISYDEVRHSGQFAAMIETLRRTGAEDDRVLQPDPRNDGRDDLRRLHEICRLENELMHRYLKHVLLFGEHQDLSQRLFKNSINHMRHWDKTAGMLVKLGDVIRIENAARDEHGVEISRRPMPTEYPGNGRLDALEALLPAEQTLLIKYEEAVAAFPAGEVRTQLQLQLGLTREHIFTQGWLLENARRIKGLS